MILDRLRVRESVPECRAERDVTEIENGEWGMGNEERGMRFLTYIDVEMPHRRDYAGLMFELTLTVNPK